MTQALKKSYITNLHLLRNKQFLLTSSLKVLTNCKNNILFLTVNIFPMCSADQGNSRKRTLDRLASKKIFFE